MHRLYLSGVQFPVAPEKLEVSINNKNETIDLMDLGEVNILKQPGLTEIKFNVLIPHRRYPFASYPDGFMEPETYLTLLEKLKTNKEPFRFIFSRFNDSGNFLFDTNMLASLESYKVIEDVENGLDYMVSINLKMYKPFGTKTFEITDQQETNDSTTEEPKEVVKAKEVNTRQTKEPAKTYVVKSGDTLWAIAKKELGDGSKYKEIAEKNDIGNPDLIFVGQELVLT